MKNWLRCSFYATMVLSLVQGCTSTSCLAPYKAGTDERSLGTYLDDTAIKDKIRAKIIADEDQEVQKAFLAISISVHKGRVVMVGEIPSEKIRERAIEIARSTKGVRKLKTYFLPKGHKSTTVSDQNIAAKVKGKFVSDPDLRAFQVEVSVVHGHVVLAGFVADQACKKKCLYHASRTRGAVKVVDFIQVK